MKVLVSGANGFVGSAICREGIRRGWEVLALVRAGSNRELVPVLAHEVSGEFHDQLRMKALLQEHRPDAVVHAAAVVSTGTPNLETSLRINVSGTEAFLREAQAAGVARWLQISSMSAHPQNNSVYGHTKLLADEVVRRGAIPWTIFRPSIIYGPQPRGIFHHMMQMLDRLPLVPVLGSGREPISPIHVDDVAAVLFDALKTPESIDKTYQIGGPDQWTFREMLAHMRIALGRFPALLPVPLPLCRLAGLAGEVCMSRPPFTLDNLEGICKAQPVDSRPARHDLLFAPRSFDEGFAECLKRFRESEKRE